jgi:hypothetical protein
MISDELEILRDVDKVDQIVRFFSEHYKIVDEWLKD